MRSTSRSLAKITRPVLSEIVPRERLFRLLDKELQKPLIWISGPAGSGKTTLAASFLDARQLPCLWYYLDEGDSDIARFFYYLGLAAKRAAPRFKNPLPLLTTEYLGEYRHSRSDTSRFSAHVELLPYLPRLPWIS